MERFDIAIIGTGPAGLEAAITAKARNKNVLLLGGEQISTKVEKAHAIRNYLGLPEISGTQLKEAFMDHVKSMELEITKDRANTIYAMGEYFAIQGHQGMYEAKTVILACGMPIANPFPGEMEHLGRGVSYCATCDAALYKGKQGIVIGYSPKEEEEAEFLAELAEEVHYISMYDTPCSLSDKISVITGKKPVRIEKNGDKMCLVMTEGHKDNSRECYLQGDGIFILRESVAPSQLVPGLQIEDNHVIVDRSLNTNIPGLFACGDITGAPYQYIKAAGEGNAAALSAVSYLAANQKNSEGE